LFARVVVARVCRDDKSGTGDSRGGDRKRKCEKEVLSVRDIMGGDGRRRESNTGGGER